MGRMRGQRGQATVELVVLLPLLAAIAAGLWQAALTGEAVWLSGSAARAGARAQAVGGDAEEAARRVLPERLRRRLRVRVDGRGAVSVRVGIPPVGGASGVLGFVSARARFAPQTP